LAAVHPGSQTARRAVDRPALLRIARELLEAIGEDPGRDGLQDTPRRFADWWCEFADYQPGRTETAFESLATDQMVVVSGIRVWSLCEHHLLPFWCEIAIGYVATDRVLGLSKFARIAHQCAHRLQVQERLTHEIADAIQQVTGAADVAVLGRGEHLCMTMRGIRTPALMTSSVMRGAFLTTPAARAEFLQLVGPPRA
jgi:GTP cyclohydrolase I